MIKTKNNKNVFLKKVASEVHKRFRNLNMGLQTKSVQLHFEYFDEWTWVSNSTTNSFLNISATTLIGKEE